MNAYFASIEQADDPKLRGRPIAVVPLMADTTFVIAASVEAKRLGVKTGVQVGEAKRILPDITLVHARPPLYVHYHKRIVSVMESILPVEKVCSIDEMRFRLLGKETDPAEAKSIAQRMKEALRDRVSENLTCSIGIAPNSFLAKLATDLQKPDGLVVIESKDLPDRIRGLKLTEFCGINRRMEARLKAAGVFSSDDLVSRSPSELELAFGSIIGRRWWHKLRGEDIEDEFEERKSLGHSHVLPPELRTDQGSRDILLRLAQKASARMRSHGLVANTLHLSVRGRKKSWEAHCALDAVSDSMTITRQIIEMWQSRDFEQPYQVGMTFTGLREKSDATPSLFADHEKNEALDRASQAMDSVNQKFGKNSVFLASLDKVKGAASEKIAFNKTWLFSEGKNDNEWPDTFRGVDRDSDEHTELGYTRDR
jgi:DNA polymerase-4